MSTRRLPWRGMAKHHHILNAASNLLGIALIIITGLNVSHLSRETIADKFAWGAALCLSASCLFSYMAIRAEPSESHHERWADRIFFAGLLFLILSVVIVAFHMR